MMTLRKKLLEMKEQSSKLIVIQRRKIISEATMKLILIEKKEQQLETSCFVLQRWYRHVLDSRHRIKVKKIHITLLTHNRILHLEPTLQLCTINHLSWWMFVLKQPWIQIRITIVKAVLEVKELSSLHLARDHQEGKKIYKILNIEISIIWRSNLGNMYQLMVSKRFLAHLDRQLVSIESKMSIKTFILAQACKVMEKSYPLGEWDNHFTQK